MKWFGLGMILMLLAGAVHGQRGSFMSAREFQALAFPDNQAAAKFLWLNGEQKQQAARILRHDFNSLRVRYWRNGDRTAWILDEVGKEQPITMGAVVEDGRIAQFAVLEFRESRGGEIRYPFFTRQFHGLSLSGKTLSGSVDGITGATLSVRAARKIAKLALFFHQQVMAAGAGESDQ